MGVDPLDERRAGQQVAGIIGGTSGCDRDKQPGAIAVRRGDGNALDQSARVFAASVLTGKDIAVDKANLWVIIAYVIWVFIYFAQSSEADGRTAGMALFGVRFVRDDGGDVDGRRAIVRTLAFPLSFLVFGLGFLGILLGGRRRALHDVIAGTAVVYSWDARAARLRFLSRE